MAGRPQAEIDWKKVERYLQAQCDGATISGLLGVAPMTLYRAVKKKYKVNFEAFARQKKAEGSEILRARQFDLAMSGNTSMLIWLGKQYLSQTDKQAIDHTTKGEKMASGIDVAILSEEEKIALLDIKKKLRDAENNK